jgi:hypothetical protein
MYPQPSLRAFVPSVETCTLHMMWPLGKLSKAPPAPKGNSNTFLRTVTVRPTIAYAAGIASPIVTRDAWGLKK